MSFREIESWSRLTGTVTRPDEVLCLTAMDEAFRSAAARLRERNESMNKGKGKYER